MLWTVRGTLKATNEDVCIVVEAESRARAEYMGERRGIPVVCATPATEEEVDEARANHLLWKRTPPSRYTCFGRPVGQAQLMLIMLCGVGTVFFLLLRQALVQLPF
jgi:hypothetical protein